jgi:hypothetical protein
VEGFNKVLVDFFSPYFLLPVTVPAGQSVGDVYEYRTWVLTERASTCFPALPASRTGASSLPALTRVAAQHAGLALGAGPLLDLDVRLGAESTVEIRFLDVTFAEVARGELRRALDPACEHLRPVVEERQELSPSRAPVIIGRVLSGRKQVFIGLQDQARLSAQADALRAALAASGGGIGAAVAPMPLEVRVAAEGEFGRRQGLVVETQQAVPIAFQPAFITESYAQVPQARATRSEGGDTMGPPLPPAAWQGFEPDANIAQRGLFDMLARDFSSQP